ncbi:MAG: hypothetical protein NW216_07685 [Hyphomicrobium sp.]|nr:hypothetical protein [Hyphomicrobium sp.]
MLLRVVAIVSALIVAACGKPAPVDTVGLRCPPPPLMRAPPPVPDVPTGFAGNRATERYIAESRARHASARRQLRGLQRYAGAVCAKGDDQ